MSYHVWDMQALFVSVPVQMILLHVYSCVNSVIPIHVYMCTCVCVRLYIHVYIHSYSHKYYRPPMVCIFNIHVYTWSNVSQMFPAYTICALMWHLGGWYTDLHSLRGSGEGMIIYKCKLLINVIQFVIKGINKYLKGRELIFEFFWKYNLYIQWKYIGTLSKGTCWRDSKRAYGGRDDYTWCACNKWHLHAPDKPCTAPATALSFC